MKFDRKFPPQGAERTVDSVRFVNVDSETTKIFIAKFTHLHHASCEASLCVSSDEGLSDKEIGSDDKVTSATVRDTVKLEAIDLTTKMDTCNVVPNADLSCDINTVDPAASDLEEYQVVTKEEESVHTASDSITTEHARQLVYSDPGYSDKLEDADMETDVNVSVKESIFDAKGYGNHIDIASDGSTPEPARLLFDHDQDESDERKTHVPVANVPTEILSLAEAGDSNPHDIASDHSAPSDLAMHARQPVVHEDPSEQSNNVPVVPPYVSDRLKFATDSGIAVQIYRGNLLSEKVDVIVCSVDAHLGLGGGAAGAIAGAAGAVLQRTCEEYIETHGSLAVTGVMHSEAGKLSPSIKYVILAAGPPAGMFSDDKQLSDAVAATFFNCMRYANDELKAGSISLPAISSGK